MVFVANFNTWALDMFDRFKNDPSVDFFTDQYCHTVVYDVHSYRGGVATVASDEDEFRTEIGIGVAYARFKGYEIPKEAIRENLSQIPNGTDFYDEASVLYRKLAKHPCSRGKYVVYKYDIDKLFIMNGNSKVYVVK